MTIFVSLLPILRRGCSQFLNSYQYNTCMSTCTARGGSTCDQRDHATKVKLKKKCPESELEKNVVHVWNFVLCSALKFTLQFQKCPPGQGPRTRACEKRSYAWVLLASSHNSSNLIGFLAFCSFCAEFWSFELLSWATAQPVLLAHSKNFFIPIGWIFLMMIIWASVRKQRCMHDVLTFCSGLWS